MDVKLNTFLQSLDVKVSRISPSEFATTRRYMGTGETRWPGPYSFDLTPYLKEPLDCLRPEVPVTRIAIMKGAQIGFALSVTTPIMTTLGWRYMEEIKVGDYVFDEKGKPTKVIKATNVMHNHKCYRVTFTDGSVIKCDAEHLWTVKDLKGVERTLNTEYISKRFKKKTRNGKSRNRYSVDNCKPLDFSKNRLPIDPYLFGLWLGDGGTNQNRISCTKNDAEKYQHELKRRSIDTEIMPDSTGNCYLKIIDAFNVWKGGHNYYGNKHIPLIYKTASIDQRLDLLQGLIDTDGHIMKDGKVEFYNTDKKIIHDVKELIASLGFKVTIRKRDNEGRYTTIHPDRKYKMKPLYVLNFMGYSELPVAKLKRKHERLRSIKDIRGEVTKRWICNVEECRSIPVKCITVDSPSHLYLAGTSFIPTHNSTGVIENAIPWIISEYPSNILLMAADDTLVKTAMTQKIDPAIDSCGVRHLIGAHTSKNKKRNHRTGDTDKSKEFYGGRLLASSVKSPQGLRQFSAKYGFLDDLDSGRTADEREGSLIKLVDGRFTTFGDTAKIYYISTPVTKQTSVIEPLFEKGDQRYYHLPCPHCGGYQYLKWSVDIDKSIHKSGKAGITFQREEKTGLLIPESVGYRCEHCGKFIEEKHKYEMNLNGEWQPTAEAKQEGFRSYHISGLYAPPGAYSWKQFAQDWCDIYPAENAGKPVIYLLKTFKNICLGQTFEEQGRGIDVTHLAVNTRNEYQVGEVPCKLSQEDGNGNIVMITIACDLNGTIDDARLDYSVMAWSEVGTTYCIDHGSIGSYQGRKTKDDDKREVMSYRNEAKNSVWNRFYKDVVNKEWKRDDNAGTMKALATTVDAGYHTVYAYEFISKSPLIFGVKGQEDNKYTPYDSDKPMFKQSTERNDLYILQSNRYKDQMADRIELTWHDKEGAQPPGFMNFPQPSGGKFTFEFFNQYAGERKDFDYNKDGVTIGSRWVKKHSSSQNHFWDCDYYNTAARDIFVKLYCDRKGVKKPTWHNFVSLVLKK